MKKSRTGSAAPGAHRRGRGKNRLAHRIAGRKLGRATDHRLALFRNLVTDLLRYEKIITTEAKAKEVRGFAERSHYSWQSAETCTPAVARSGSFTTRRSSRRSSTSSARATRPARAATAAW